MAFGTAMAMPMLGGHSEHRLHFRHRNADTEPFPEVPLLDDMSSSESRGKRDTGFPEPLNDDRNTTLPYPGADLSPNARITMGDGLLNADVFSKRSFRRSRLSKNKRGISSGRITPHFEALQSNVSIAETTSGMSRTSSSGTNRPGTGNAPLPPVSTPVAPAPVTSTHPSSRVPATPISASYSTPRTSREETDSFRSRSHDETPPSSPESRSSRKGGFLSRWRSRRD